MKYINIEMLSMNINMVIFFISLMILLIFFYVIIFIIYNKTKNSKQNILFDTDMSNYMIELFERVLTDLIGKEDSSNEKFNKYLSLLKNNLVAIQFALRSDDKDRSSEEVMFFIMKYCNSKKIQLTEEEHFELKEIISLIHSITVNYLNFKLTNKKFI